MALKTAALQPSHPPPGAIPGWHPSRLPDGKWGARTYDAVPHELVGRKIIVTDRRGRHWTATVLEVVERSDSHVLVRDSGRYPRTR